MANYRDVMYEAEVLANRVRFGIKNLGVIQVALAEEAVAGCEASEAIYCVYDYLHVVCDQLYELIECTISKNK